MESAEAIAWLFLGFWGFLGVKGQMESLSPVCRLPASPPMFPSFPSSYVTTHLPLPPRHVLWSRAWGPHTLFNHSIGRQAGALLGHPAAGRGASFSLSSCPTPQNCWTHWAAPTNQTVCYSHTALITAVCRNEKDRLNQSDLAGNHSMLFKSECFRNL